MKTTTMQHRFVENIPDEVEGGILYISLPFCIAIRKCVYGCGNEISTPISPTGWELYFDGKNGSLYPSIGNWSYECQSHYSITKSKTKHALPLTDEKVNNGRNTELMEIQRFCKKWKRK